MRSLLIILSFLSFCICENSIDNQNKFKKHNLSVGCLTDDKTGVSILGYTYNIKQNEMNEYFIGGGTAILAFTGTVGWKHYYKKSKSYSIYSVLSEQAVMHMGFSGFMSTASIGLEYNFKKIQIKYGLFGLFIIRTDQNRQEFGLLPFIGLNFNF